MHNEAIRFKVPLALPMGSWNEEGPKRGSTGHTDDDPANALRGSSFVGSQLAAYLSAKFAASMFLQPDAVQLLTYLLIFASLLLAIRSRALNERNQQMPAIKEERRISLCRALLFIILIAAFVWGRSGDRTEP